jgi:hypothetical protein
MNVKLVVGQQFLDSMRMGSPGKPPQSFSRSGVLNGLKREELAFPVRDNSERAWTFPANAS